MNMSKLTSFHLQLVRISLRLRNLKKSKLSS
jgi:hypothetical protein